MDVFKDIDFMHVKSKFIFNMLFFLHPLPQCTDIWATALANVPSDSFLVLETESYLECRMFLEFASLYLTRLFKLFCEF